MRASLTAVVILVGFCFPITAEPGWFPKIYDVPSNFLDPSAVSLHWTPQSQSPEERYAPRKSTTARSILESIGVEFPEGSYANYDQSASKLTVYNTGEQLKKIDAYLEARTQFVQYEIYLTVRELTYSGDMNAMLEELAGKSDDLFSKTIRSLFQFPDHAESATKFRQTSTFDSYASFHEELSHPLKSPEVLRRERRIRVSGSLTDPQFQVFIRSLSHVRGIDLLSLPSVMARSGTPVITRSEKRRFGIIPVLSSEKGRIELDLFIPTESEPLYESGEALRPTVSTLTEDGRTVVLAEKNPDGQNRLIFVQAQLMDPNGLPIDPVEKRKSDVKDTPAADQFLVTDYPPLSKWFDDNFEVEYTEMSPQQIFDQVPLNDIRYETSNLPTEAPRFSLSSEKISRRELLLQIADFWNLRMSLLLDENGNPNAVKVEGTQPTASNETPKGEKPMLD